QSVGRVKFGGTSKSGVLANAGMLEPTLGKAAARGVTLSEKSLLSFIVISTSKVSSVNDSGFGRSLKWPTRRGYMIVPAGHECLTPGVRLNVPVAGPAVSIPTTISQVEKSLLAMIHVVPKRTGTSRKNMEVVPTGIVSLSSHPS